jgi:group I intron endonuclease
VTDYYVYMWTNTVNGKRYIGKGRGHRAMEHFKASKQGECPAFHAALAKYGRAAFVLDYLSTGIDNATACAVEVAAISAFQSSTAGNRGYNISAGGDAPDHAPESIEKMRAVARRRLSDPAAKRAWVDASHSPEARSRRSASLRAASAPRIAAAVAAFDGTPTGRFAARHGLNNQTLRRELRAAGWTLIGRTRDAKWIPPTGSGQ